MWVLSQVLCVRFGLTERKMLARFESRLEPANALCWLRWRWAWGLRRHIKASDEVTGFRRLRALPSWAKGEFLVLFPTPNESSFRTLTCLLAKPQEGNDAVLASGLPGWSFIQTLQRTDIQTEAPCRVEEFWLYTPASGFFWMNTHISVTMRYVWAWTQQVQCQAVVSSLQEGF